MKAGDLVKFWDYEGGNGWVPGLIVKIVPGISTQTDENFFDAIIMYKNNTQRIPLERSWIVDIEDELW